MSADLCMICGEPALDADDSEPDLDSNDPEAWILWVYCRKCDAWTEHPYIGNRPAREAHSSAESATATE